jgi:hypothetical protein
MKIQPITLANSLNKSSDLEQLIDLLVCYIYGLTEEEIRIVEGGRLDQAGKIMRCYIII